jgi:hypothetical protein
MGGAMTSVRSLVLGAVLAVGLAPCALAGVITVANPSFEILPAGGLPNGCGPSCSYSIAAIPEWATTGESGQFQPGPPATTAYFDTVPDGITVAYTNGGTISQTVAATAVAGDTYTLNTEVGVRHDVGDPGLVELVVGGHTVLATGSSPQPGGWADWTASYKATAADAGVPIEIILSSSGVQGDWDDVRLTSSVPEPATWAMFLLGVGMIGGGLRTARSRSGAATIAG